MAILVYRDATGALSKHEFRGDLRIGADSRNQLVLPAGLGVAPEHALMTRSALNRVPVLIDLAAGQTWVEGRPVVGLQVLRHGAHIRLGAVELTLLELRIVRLRPGERAIGRACQICKDSLCAGDEVVSCPYCRILIHRSCWADASLCPNYNCSYSMHSAVMDALADQVHFERDIAEDSRLVERFNRRGTLVNQGTFCQAGEPRDQVTFQPHERAAFCPRCDTAFHLECWLRLEQCPVCRFDVWGLIDRAFRSPESEAEDEQEPARIARVTILIHGGPEGGRHGG